MSAADKPSDPAAAHDPLGEVEAFITDAEHDIDCNQAQPPPPSGKHAPCNCAVGVALAALRAHRESAARREEEVRALVEAARDATSAWDCDIASGGVSTAEDTELAMEKAMNVLCAALRPFPAPRPDTSDAEA